MATQSKKNKKKVDLETDNQKLGRIVSRMFFFLILIVLPCYYDKQVYLNMIGAKGQCALILCYITIVGIVCYYFHGLLAGEYKFDFTFKRWHPIDYVVLLLVLGMAIACFTSANINECLSGSKGFYNGALKLGLLALIYFFTSRHIKAEKKIWDIVFIVSDVISLWMFINFCTIDIFGHHAMILEEQYYFYSSCLGNVDSISAYYSIFASVVFIFFLNEDDEKRLPAMTTHMAFVIMGVLTTHSDGLMFGLFFMSLIFVVYALEDSKRLERAFLILAVVGAEMTFLRLLHVASPEKVHFTNELTNTLMDKWVGVPVLIVFGLLYFWARKSKKGMNIGVLKVLSKVYVVLASVGFIGASIYIMNNLTNDFGTGRGGIWKGGVALFKDLDFGDKLFGLGPHMVREGLTEKVYEYIEDGNLAFAPCHNGILEVMNTLGIWGMVFGIALWAIMLVPFFKNHEGWTTERVAYLAAAFAYLGQSMVGNPYSMTVPMFYLMIMLYRDQVYQARLVELNESEAPEVKEEIKSAKNNKSKKK